MTTRKQMYNLTKKLEKFVGNDTWYNAHESLRSAKKTGLSTVMDLEDTVLRVTGASASSTITRQDLLAVRRSLR